MTTAAATDLIDKVFRALASRQRREILTLLATGGGAGDVRCCSPEEVCACVFAEKLGLGAPTISHHMKALIDAELVSAEKRAQWVYYRLRTDTISKVAGELMSMAGCGAMGCGTAGGGD